VRRGVFTEFFSFGFYSNKTNVMKMSIRISQKARRDAIRYYRTLLPSHMPNDITAAAGLVTSGTR